MLRHVRKMITMQAALMIFKSVFLGVLDYGSIFVSSLPDYQNKLRRIFKFTKITPFVAASIYWILAMSTYLKCMRTQMYNVLDIGWSETCYYV